MIQDAHPLRSGVPDGYKALYQVAIVVAASDWRVNSDRLPSGFGAGSNVFNATGIANMVFPAGQKVRSARASVSPPTTTITDQRSADVVNINEAAGTFQVAISDRATPSLANPVVNSTLWVELTLETV